MVAAAVIFAIAVIVAVVQATGSDESASASEAAQSAQSEPSKPAAQQQDQQPSEQAAQPTVQSEESAAQSQAANAQSDAQSDAQSVDEEQTQQMQPVAEQPTDAEVSESADSPLLGFIVPIAGACVTEFEGHLPGATRAYRNHGTHEGLDFYQWASCVTVDYSTAALAAKAGVVIRADVDYVDITPADWARFQEDWEAPGVLDEARGRQVWIDHGRGIVTRYAHLSAIAAEIAVGAEVAQGQIVGYVGESGQREVYNAPGTDLHLHFEIRVGDGWLGEGLAPQAARQLYLVAFGLAQP